MFKLGFASFHHLKASQSILNQSLVCPLVTFSISSSHLSWVFAVILTSCFSSHSFSLACQVPSFLVFLSFFCRSTGEHCPWLSSLPFKLTAQNPNVLFVSLCKDICFLPALQLNSTTALSNKHLPAIAHLVAQDELLLNTCRSWSWQLISYKAVLIYI